MKANGVNLKKITSNVIVHFERKNPKNICIRYQLLYDKILAEKPCASRIKLVKALLLHVITINCVSCVVNVCVQ